MQNCTTVEIMHNPSDNIICLSLGFEQLMIPIEEEDDEPSQHPVKTILSDIIKDEIPLTYMRTCKSAYYHTLSSLYRRVSLTSDNIIPFFHGLIIQHLSPYPGGESTFEFGSRKLEAFDYVKRISFKDRSTAEKFVKFIKFFSDQIFGSLDNTPQLFRQVVNIHLHNELVNDLFTVYDDITRPETFSLVSTINLPAFLFILNKHCIPDSFSIDWPSNWSKDTIDYTWQPRLPYVAESFFDNLIRFTGVDQIYINVLESDLLSVWLRFMIPHETVNVSIHITLFPEENDDMILYLIRTHFDLINDPPKGLMWDEEILDLEFRLTYILPYKESLIDQIERLAKYDYYKETWKILGTMISFRDMEDILLDEEDKVDEYEEDKMALYNIEESDEEEL